MRPAYALVAIALCLGACGSGDDPARSQVAATDTMTDATPPTEPSSGVGSPDDEAPPPATGGQPEPTLELNPPKASPPPAPTPPAAPDDALFPGERDPGLDGFVDTAVADLATRLEVEPDSIAVVSATLVTWPDSSMGCPVPGMQYLQVLQDGSLIELEHDGALYRYHTGGDRITPFLCDQPSATPPIRGGAAGD